MTGLPKCYLLRSRTQEILLLLNKSSRCYLGHTMGTYKAAPPVASSLCQFSNTSWVVPLSCGFSVGHSRPCVIWPEVTSPSPFPINQCTAPLSSDRAVGWVHPALHPCGPCSLLLQLLESWLSSNDSSSLKQLLFPLIRVSSTPLCVQL